MPDTPSPTETSVQIPVTPGASKKAESSPTDLVLKVLGAVGTGIGILGFVTFFGGAIVWLRADKAQLPATEAVAVIPRNVLVTTGATFLLPAVLIAVGVVAIVFLIDLCFYLSRFPRLKSTREQAKTFGREAAQRGRSALAAQQAWKLANAALEARKENLKQARDRRARGTEITKLEAKVKEQKVEAGGPREG